MRITSQFTLISGAFIICALPLIVWYKLQQDLYKTQLLIETLSMQKKFDKEEKKSASSTADIVAPKSQLWSTLQMQLKDTVVQVFSQVAEFNWIEPYKTPTQSEGSGSAFFIDNQGHLITNAHVIDQAKVVYIQIPTLGKRRFEVETLGLSHDRDLALLKLNPDDVSSIKKSLGKDQLPFLKLGNSDSINRADKLMALGYPLGQQGLKSTTGVVSGREHLEGQHFIQISAALNPGNSGGPSLNNHGEVIGVNSAGIMSAQNVGYIIPINEVKLFLTQLTALEKPQSGPKLLRKPFLGVLFNNASDDLTQFLKNPAPGGLFVVEVYKGSPLYKAGVKSGDMIYSINSIPVDIYGEMNVGWSLEDKVSIIDYVSRLNIGETINLEYYRNGVKKNATFEFSQSELPPIRRMHPAYEHIDYEVIGGMVIMQLTLNHILLLARFVPELLQYADLKKHREPALIITHVLLNSSAKRSRCVTPGAIISEINQEKVRTLQDFRKVLLKSANSGFLTIKTTENIFVALPVDDIISNEMKLSNTYFYPISQGFKSLANIVKVNSATANVSKASPVVLNTTQVSTNESKAVLANTSK